MASTGEQVSVGLLSLALRPRGCRLQLHGLAGRDRSPTAPHRGANREVSIDVRVRADLAAGNVVVVTGFRGVDPDGHITTLGRGGSDTRRWRSRPRSEAARVPDLHRCRRRLHDRSASSSPTHGVHHRHLRGNARAVQPRAPRCFRSARSSSPASTASPCACCRASRRGTSTSTRRRARARLTFEEDEIGTGRRLGHRLQPRRGKDQSVMGVHRQARHRPT